LKNAHSQRRNISSTKLCTIASTQYSVQEQSTKVYGKENIQLVFCTKYNIYNVICTKHKIMFDICKPDEATGILNKN